MALLAGSAVAGPSPAFGQQQGELPGDLLASEERLEEVREERRRLQDELGDLEARVANAAAELRNLERQLSASRSALAEIRFQMEARREEAEETSDELARTRERLEERQEALGTRIREIYKRGPLHTVEVLLGADSFADLLNRYRYLRLLTRYDRSLLEEVAALEEELEERQERLGAELDDLERLQEAQRAEVAELEELEEERQRVLERYRAERDRTAEELEEVEDVIRLDDLDWFLTEIHRARRTSHGNAPAPPGAGGFTAADRGALPWPVAGEAVREPGGDDAPSDGVAIRAPFGEPVRAVRPGSVVLAGPMQEWGSVVVLAHGGGHYTAYLHMDEAGVVQGRTVEEGQVVGLVGGRDTELGAHLWFHVWGEDLEPSDPLEWLRPESEREEAWP